jgi:hypothetical protein
MAGPTSKLTHLTFGFSLVGVLLVAASRIVEALATISETVERERQRREGVDSYNRFADEYRFATGVDAGECR